ncbi:hypothetical protein [Kolteria novifilia]|uniref:hypothetical protein n=1 Tax=Kolteria novifilia TaxID=2527975 RepID=UPI003AF399E5
MVAVCACAERWAIASTRLVDKSVGAGVGEALEPALAEGVGSDVDDDPDSGVGTGAGVGSGVGVGMGVGIGMGIGDVELLGSLRGAGVGTTSGVSPGLGGSWAATGTISRPECKSQNGIGSNCPDVADNGIRTGTDRVRGRCCSVEGVDEETSSEALGDAGRNSEETSKWNVQVCLPAGRVGDDAFCPAGAQPSSSAEVATAGNENTTTAMVACSQAVVADFLMGPPVGR